VSAAFPKRRSRDLDAADEAGLVEFLNVKRKRR
jgi:hypothetical protein